MSHDKTSLEQLLKEPLYQHILEQPHDLNARLVLADLLDDQEQPLGSFIRAQFDLADGDAEKHRRTQVFRQEWEFLRDEGSALLTPGCEWVWDWPWPNITWTNLGQVLRPTFGKEIIPGILWQFTHGLPDTLGISGHELLAQAEHLFAQYPIQHLAVSYVTSEPMLAAVRERGVLYPTDRRWARLEDIIHLSQLEQLRSLSMEGAHLEVEDVEMIVQCPRLKNLQRLTLIVAPTAVEEAARKIASSEVLANLQALEFSYHPNHEPERENKAQAITDDVVRTFVNSPHLTQLEDLVLYGESVLLEDPITADGFKAVMDSGRITRLAISTTRLNDETLRLVAEHPNARKLKSLKVSPGVLSKEGIEQLAKYDHWDNLEVFDCQYPRSMVNFDVGPFARSGNFPKLRSLRARNVELSPETVQAISKGLPSLRELTLQEPISEHTDPADAEQLFSRLDYMKLPLTSEKLGTTLANAHFLEHVPAWSTVISTEGQGLKPLLNARTNSQLQLLEFDVDRQYRRGQRDLQFSWDQEWTKAMVDSGLGQNLIAMIDAGETSPNAAFRKRWGPLYLHVAQQREIIRRLHRRRESTG